MDKISGLPWWRRRQRICLWCKRPRFDPWVRKIHWKREWQPTPVFLPGEFHGQRSLVGYSSWGHKELDTTEWLFFPLYDSPVSHSSQMGEAQFESRFFCVHSLCVWGLESYSSVLEGRFSMPAVSPAAKCLPCIETLVMMSARSKDSCNSCLKVLTPSATLPHWACQIKWWKRRPVF